MRNKRKKSVQQSAVRFFSFTHFVKGSKRVIVDSVEDVTYSVEDVSYSVEDVSRGFSL